METSSVRPSIPPITSGTPSGWPPPVLARPPAAERSWTAWVLASVASIWAAVLLISVFSPDMISGSEHQRMPIAAFGTWMWGCGASIAAVVSMARLRGDIARRPLWITLSVATMAIWSVAALVSIFGPTTVTGSDPTTIPVAALIAPVVATLAIMVAGTVVLVANGLSRSPHLAR